MWQASAAYIEHKTKDGVVFTSMNSGMSGSAKCSTSVQC